jgi:hypothetical protein
VAGFAQPRNISTQPLGYLGHYHRDSSSFDWPGASHLLKVYGESGLGDLRSKIGLAGTALVVVAELGTRASWSECQKSVWAADVDH